jgi:hypothetical protein
LQIPGLRVVRGQTSGYAKVPFPGKEATVPSEVNMVVLDNYPRSEDALLPRSRMGVYGDSLAGNSQLTIFDMDRHSKHLGLELVTDAQGSARLEITNTDRNLVPLQCPELGLDRGPAVVSVDFGHLMEDGWAGQRVDLTAPENAPTKYEYIGVDGFYAIEVHGQKGVLMTLSNQNGLLHMDAPADSAYGPISQRHIAP